MRDALEPDWWAKYGLAGLGYADLESEAAAVREVTLSYVPGLLQTPACMQVVFEADRSRRTKSELAKQLEHLITMSELPSVGIRVLPADLGIHGGLTGAFTLLEFPDPEDPNMLYIEYPTGSAHFEEKADVQRARVLFEHLCTKAMSHDESVALVERMLTG